MPPRAMSGSLNATVAPMSRSTVIGDFHDPYGASVGIGPILSEHVGQDALSAEGIPDAERKAGDAEGGCDPAERSANPRRVEHEAEPRRNERHRNGRAQGEQSERGDGKGVTADGREEEDTDAGGPSHAVDEADGIRLARCSRP